VPEGLPTNGSPHCRPTRPGSAGTHQALGWHVDEAYIKVNGVWRYVYRAVDQHGQVIDVLVSARRNGDAARRFFRRALATLKVKPTKVVTDAAPVYPGVLDELIPSAWHHVERHANNPIEADHSQLKHRLRPMRGLHTDRTVQTIIAGHANPEPAPRTLRTCHRYFACSAGRRSVHRTRTSDLTADPTRVQHVRRFHNASAPLRSSGR